MKILLLSPQPFYQVRGTPIAIDLLVSTLSKQGHEIDLVTYHEGEQREYYNVRHIRTPSLRFLNNIRPGFSFKKLCCSTLLFFKAWGLVRTNKYDLIHANEEAVFMAYMYKKIYKTPYVYDMDSSLSGQMKDKLPALATIIGLAGKFEHVAMRNASGVLAVCEALCKLARPYNDNVFLLTDVAMLDRLEPGADVESLTEGLPPESTTMMYIGNLEAYQGVDLMLESFSKAYQCCKTLRLIIIGGNSDSIDKYRFITNRLGVSDVVIFAGPKPFDDVGEYMSQADVLLSPRIHGENTPMKVYNYMASGKAIIATKIYSHTQVLNSDTSELTDVNAESLSKAMIAMATDKDKRLALGRASQIQAGNEYSVASFERKVADFFGALENRV